MPIGAGTAEKFVTPKRAGTAFAIIHHDHHLHDDSARLPSRRELPSLRESGQSLPRRLLVQHAIESDSIHFTTPRAPTSTPPTE
ncbi:hypothetical protein BST61_g11136 [Cercospora zeina]